METNINDLIEDDISIASKGMEAIKKLEGKLSELLDRKREIEDEIVSLSETHIKPLNDALAFIESRIHHIFIQSGMEKFKNESFSIKINEPLVVKITDMEKLLKFSLDNTGLIKTSDIVNKKRLEELIESKVEVPGIELSHPVKKISYRKV